MSVAKAILVVLLLLPIVVATNAPGPEPSPYKYRQASAPDETWNNVITTTGQTLLLGQNSRSECLPLGFALAFFDRLVPCMYAWDDGLLSAYGTQLDIPTRGNNNYPPNQAFTIAGLYADWDLSRCNAQMRYGTRNIDGTDNFFIQWINVHYTGRTVIDCNEEPGSDIQIRIEDKTYDIYILVQDHQSDVLENNNNYWGEIGVASQTTWLEHPSGEHDGERTRFYPNHAPRVVSEYLTAPEGGSIDFSLSYEDIDADTVVLWEMDDSSLTAGSITGADGDYTYWAPSYIPETQVVKARATDNLGKVGPWANIFITVVFVNDAPTFDVTDPAPILSESGTVAFSKIITNIDAGYQDGDQDIEFTVEPATPEIFQSLPVVYRAGNVADMMMKFAPEFIGTETLKVTARDNGGTSFGGVDTSIEQFITITVNERPPHALPIVQDITLTVPEDTPVTLPMTGYDPDGEPVTLAIATPGIGNAYFDGSKWRYIGPKDFNGVDSFTYIANDGELDSLEGTIDITVTPVNDAPVAQFDVVQALSTGSTDILAATLLANDVDVDGDLLTTELGAPAFGFLSMSGDDYVYIPAGGFTGIDTIPQVVRDPSGYSDESFVLVGVSDPSNPLPTAVTDSLETDEDLPLFIDEANLIGNDLDATTPEVLWIGGATEGSIVDGLYTPNPEYSGSDAATYLLHDGNGGLAWGTISLTIHNVDDPPVAAFSYTTATTALSQSMPISFVDESGEGDNPIVSWSYSFGDGNLFTGQHPTHSFSDVGDYDVTLTVTDSAGQSDAITKSLNVANAAPTISIDTTGIFANRPITFSATTSEDTTHVSWNMGDGWSFQGANVQHTYPLGVYTVTATATDAEGAQTTAVKVVEVSSAAPTAPSYSGVGGSNGVAFQVLQENPRVATTTDPEPEPEPEPENPQPDLTPPEPIKPTYQTASAPSNAGAYWILSIVFVVCLVGVGLFAFLRKR